MHTSRAIATLFSLSLVAAACTDNGPAAPATPPTLQHRDKAAERATLLADVAAAGALTDASGTVGSFTGRFTATRFDIDPVTRGLNLTGVVSGAATLANGTTVPVIAHRFTAPVDLSSARRKRGAGVMRPVSETACETSSSTAGVTRVAFVPVQGASCDVLFLDLGPISLDLLGLTLDLSQVVLDVNAVTGPGNLLGNLLCALLGLLDITALLTSITQLLETINNILAGLNPGGAVGASLEHVAPAAAYPALSA